MKSKIVLIGLTAMLLVGCGNNKKSENPSKTQYLITFNDENGNLLESKKWDEGTIPSYNYEKLDTVEWDYTFKGWSEVLNGSIITVPAATQDATYYAIVDATKQKFTITFDSNDGTQVDSITQEYGSLVNEPTKPTKEGYSFVSWCTDSSLNTAVTWPYEIKGNKTFYAKWNEKVGIIDYLSSLLSALGQDPYSYIPDTMKPTNSSNYVNASDVNYNFNQFTNVANIKYGGFGEQWQMVIDNIQESERFYMVFTIADNVISASAAAFNNWFDKNPSSTNKEIDETGYYAKVDFKNGVLSYTIQFKTGFTIPLFGEVLPQIDMTYDISNKEKSVRVNLTDTNAMRYVVNDDKYVFGIEYGVEAVSRSAYCQINRVNNGCEGHIYEYIAIKDKDAIHSCADFYIGDTYTSVVGNKANGIIGMDGYINELYKTSEGKLLGYKVQETQDFPIIGTSTYHTLWFNLNNISGINSIKAIPNGNTDIAAKNIHDIYVNGSTSIFEPTYNKVTLIKTSRKYDIEMRTQYRYGLNGGELTRYETSIPMMFIQDDHDEYTNYSDFVKDIKTDNGITASVNLSSTYLSKIRSDYETLIPLFKENKELVNSETIKNWIGTAVK